MQFGLSASMTPKTVGYNTPFGHNPQGSNYAQNNFASLTRDQWAEYVKTFIPIENQLIEYATNPQVVTDAMTEASADVNAAFDARAGTIDRRLKGLGIDQSPEQEAAQTRSFGLAKSLADVQAQNIAGQTTRQRQMSVLGNPAPQGA